MIRHVVLASAIGLASGVTAQASPMHVATFEKVVFGSSRLTAASFSSLDPTCKSLGPMTISLIEAPHDGRVQIAQGQDFPSFPMFNARAHCNARKRPATFVFYTAAPGYTGRDAFALELVDPVGNVSRVRYRVTVR
ncbi:hypothetical protein ASG51_06830 [Methylobacterium sp. Leaf465]|nr:hypothetical protein ASG51_06830 [Methylobacterium sp. Leaf465]